MSSELMKMGFSFTFFTAVVFTLTTIVAVSFGEIVVLRGPPIDNTTRNLTCVSEDDGSVLIWNYNWQGDDRLKPSIIEDFRPRIPSTIVDATCAVWGNESCVAHWRMKDKWEMVNSSNRPMGPVFDYRWEGFREFVFDKDRQDQDYQYVGKVEGDFRSVIFSARGREIDILLCDAYEPTQGPCLRIIIGGKRGQIFSIWSYKFGTTDAHGPENCTGCENVEQTSKEPQLEEFYEWRTFRIEWEKTLNEEKIKLYENLSTVPLLRGTVGQTSSGSHIFVRSNITSSRIRFHFYEYFLTDKNNALLSTTEFFYWDQHFCVELLVGLCPDCEIKFELTDVNDLVLLTKHITRDKNSALDAPLSWQTMKFNGNLSRLNSYPVKLRFQTVLKRSGGGSQWAVDNVRMCKSDGLLRQSTITIHADPLIPNLTWPLIYCQKLSYRENVIVSTVSNNTLYNDTKNYDQFRSMLVNTCNKNHYQECPMLNDKWSICKPTGCACNRGFRGSDCSGKCADFTYGYDCNMQCGSCNEGYCEKISGKCTRNTCKNETLVPPFCKELGTPRIENITDTTARVYLSVDTESSSSISSLEFKIQSDIQPPAEQRTILKEETTEELLTYETNLRDLEPNTTYLVKTFLVVKGSFKGVKIHENIFTTTSLGFRCFEVKAQKFNLTLYQRWDSEVCGDFIGGPYTLILDPATRRGTGTKVEQTLPGTLTGLKPYTKYNLTYYNEKRTIFWTTEICTLESAPERVQNLHKWNVSDTKVTLSWASPIEANGIIRGYSVSIKRIEVRGCDQKLPPQDAMSKDVNGTTAFFEGLKPYSTYNATVIAHTTEAGMATWIKFPTQEADIPTSNISNFKLVGNELYWTLPDCTTISGPAKDVRLFFQGLSHWVQEWKIEKQTAYQKFDLKKVELLPYTWYRVRAHVARKNKVVINPDLYGEIQWRTAASVPLQIRSLEVYEADPESNTISLRWKPPYPPTGEIESYHVAIYRGGKKFKNFEVPKGLTTCDQWTDYVCLENLELPGKVTIDTNFEIYAKNINISGDGPSAFRVKTPDFYYAQAPGDPHTFGAIHQGHGIVNLTWWHPSISSTKIKQFRIRVDRRWTNLLEEPSTQYPKTVHHRVMQRQTAYSKTLPLEPSAEYYFSIVAVNGRNITSTANVSTRCLVPHSLDFVIENERKARFIDSSIEFYIPQVTNATRNTTIEVVVKGLSLCETNQPHELLALNNPIKSVTKWVAAIYKVDDIPRQPIRIGPDEYRGVTLKCSLIPKEPYKILFVAKDWYSTETIQYEESLKVETNEPKATSLTWLIIFPILACLLLLLVVYRRYRKAPLKSSQQNILQLEPTTIGLGNSTAPSTLKRATPPPIPMPNQVSVHQVSPDVVPSYNPTSHPVKVEKFEEYVQKTLASGLLESQYEILPKSFPKMCNHATLAENAPKNRYRDRVPYDETRVILEKISGDSHSDYINANYIQGYRKKKAYIATQGPKPKTIDDFWRMIWQENVHVICMLAKVVEGGKKKCEQYWPEVGQKEKYGNVQVSFTKQQVFADYTIRTFLLVYRKETREVTHFHYTGWPDHGVPMYTQSLVAYMKKLLGTPTGGGPVVVHCSAGVGRTGTIILCDICLRGAVAERMIDVPGALIRMREERANMVDNAQQYLLVHLAIVESMVVEQTQLHCNSSLIQKITMLRKQLPSDIQRLKDAVWQDRALHFSEHTRNLAQGDVATDFIPGPRIWLNNSINAVDVVGVKMNNQFLATQLPSSSTLSDYWKLIRDRDIELVIILQRPSPNDPNFCDLVPSESTLDPTPEIQVERHLVPEITDHFTIDKLSLTDSSTPSTQRPPVFVITCTGWEPGESGKPPSATALVSLWMASEKIPRQRGQTLLLCHDGVTGCGLYLALNFLLERMAVERECDVISAVRAVRRSRTEFVQSLDQFEYLYDAAIDYAKRFEIYSNFA